MNRRVACLLPALLGGLLLSCTPDLAPGTEPPAESATRGFALRLAAPDTSERTCVVDPEKATLVGTPLVETELDFYDAKTGIFHLKKPQYDWLYPNREAIRNARRNGYYAMVITLDGQKMYAGLVLSDVASLACGPDNDVFWEDVAYRFPNPVRSADRQLPLRRNLAPSPDLLPRLPQAILDRLQAVGKLRS